MRFPAKHKGEESFERTRQPCTFFTLGSFGGCLADYRGWYQGYGRLRALKDVDQVKTLKRGSYPVGAHARIRLVNYYTLAPGRPRPSKPTHGGVEGRRAAHTWPICPKTRVSASSRGGSHRCRLQPPPHCENCRLCAVAGVSVRWVQTKPTARQRARRSTSSADAAGARASRRPERQGEAAPVLLPPSRINEASDRA